MGYLHVDVYANGTWTNDVFMIGGNQGDVWETSLVLLAAFNGNIINIRFRGVTGSSGSQSDMAIDDILVAEGLGMSENTNAEFMLYPNPAQNQLTIAELTGGMVNTVQVYNAMGQEVLQKNNVNAQGSYV